MDSKIVNELLEQRSVEEVMSFSRKVNEPLSKEQASKVFNEIGKRGELSDDYLSEISAGWKWPWQDDKNPPAPKFKVGQKVWVSFEGETYHGVILSISSERQSLFGFNPEWVYTIDFISGGGSHYQESYYEGALHLD